MGEDHSLLAEELGRTQTVKDVEHAYKQLVEGRRKLAVERKHYREGVEKQRGEVEAFLDDMQHITGLAYDSPLFWRLVGMTIDMRLRRHQVQADDNGGFPKGW